MRSVTLYYKGKAHIDRVSAQHFHVCAATESIEFARLYFGADAEERAWRDAKLIAFEGKAPPPLWSRVA